MAYQVTKMELLGATYGAFFVNTVQFPLGLSIEPSRYVIHKYIIRIHDSFKILQALAV